MKIRKLWISSYKNVENLELEFQTELTTLLVGQNGLGKSNLLEVLALIFRDLDLLKSLDDFIEWPTKKGHFDYIINYLCKGRDITIFNKANRFAVFELVNDEKVAYSKYSVDEFLKNRPAYLPDYIIGYYSGTNHRIKDFFATHNESRVKNIRKQGDNSSSLGKLFYSDQALGELSLITLWTYKTHEKYKPFIEKILHEYLEIDPDSGILLGFNNPKYFTPKSKFKDLSAENILINLLAKEKDRKPYPFWGLDGKLNELFQSLWDNNMTINEPITFDDEAHDNDKSKSSFISFNDLNFNSLHENLSENNIKTPLELFDVLLIAKELDIIYEVNSTLVKNGGVINHNYKELSEGEQQLLTILSLILFTSEKDCLYLLDEPDTHLNPKWQREYIQLLNEFNLTDNNSHIFVATHSPLLVQSVEDEDNHRFDIILYSKNKGGEIEIENKPRIIKNWRIDQVLASKYFSVKTRPKELDKLMELRLEIIRKGSLTDEDKVLLKNYEDSIGYLPTGETIDELKAMAFIKVTADRLKYDQNK